LKDVSWLSRRVESNVIGLPPPVRLAGKLVDHNEVGGAFHSERRQVKPDGGLSRLVRVKVRDDQDGVLGLGQALGEADQLRLVDVMEP
jgi:hypothetical protein